MHVSVCMFCHWRGLYSYGTSTFLLFVGAAGIVIPTSLIPVIQCIIVITTSVGLIFTTWLCTWLYSTKNTRNETSRLDPITSHPQSYKINVYQRIEIFASNPNIYNNTYILKFETDYLIRKYPDESDQINPTTRLANADRACSNGNGLSQGTSQLSNADHE